MKQGIFALLLGSLMALTALPVRATAPHTTVNYQVMVATGLAARHPFEVWFVFDKSSDPTVPGYTIPAGATILLTFPKAFTPGSGVLGAVRLKGWAQGSIPAKFTVAVDKRDPRVVAIHLDAPIEINLPEQPGLKAIHLRTGLINPAKTGNYPILIQFVDAGHGADHRGAQGRNAIQHPSHRRVTVSMVAPPCTPGPLIHWYSPCKAEWRRG